MTVLSDKYENGSLFFGTQRGITCSETPVSTCMYPYVISQSILIHYNINSIMSISGRKILFGTGYNISKGVRKPWT